MEVCVLASGSKGNCVAIRGGGVSLLVDIGLSARETAARMRKAGIDPAGLAGILFTHNHGDHCKGAPVFAKKTGVRLYANEGTAQGIDQAFPNERMEWTIFETSRSLEIGGLEIDTFSVSHDAADPVGFVFREGKARLFLATDLGCVTELVRVKLQGCGAAILESNHDYSMLMGSNRSWTLKARINGRSGHLSNADAAELIRTSAPPTLKTLLLAHLSEECNTPALAARAMRDALRAAGREDVDVRTLSQSQISPLFTVTA